MDTKYHVDDSSLYLDTAQEGVDHTYNLKIHDLPLYERPREKLLAHGPSVLTVQELVAVLLNTGTRKEDVLNMSARILKEYGERTLAGYTDPKKLARDLEIPIVKATQIVASAELGRRFFARRGNVAATIRTPKDVYEHVKDMHYLSKEHLRGLYLNVHHRLVHDEVLSIGTLTSNVIHPREVFKPALEYSAAGIILVHNHPSGEVTPSFADVEITKQIVEAGKIMGIAIMDHVIVAGEQYISVKVDYGL